MTDPTALADLGDIPPGETVVEIPVDLLRLVEDNLEEER